MQRHSRSYPSGRGMHSRISPWQAMSLSWPSWFTVAMPKRRLPSMQRRTSSLYRGSKMFSCIFSPASRSTHFSCMCLYSYTAPHSATLAAHAGHKYVQLHLLTCKHKLHVCTCVQEETLQLFPQLQVIICKQNCSLQLHILVCKRRIHFSHLPATASKSTHRLYSKPQTGH